METLGKKMMTNGIAWDEEDMNLVSQLAQHLLDYDEACKTGDDDAFFNAVRQYQETGARLARKNPQVYEAWRQFYAEYRK